MFWHLYKYRLKVLINNKYLLFWLGIFPIILGTMFNMVFSDITEKTETMSTIGVIVTANKDSDVDAEEILDNDEALATFLNTMEEREYFEVTYADYDEAISKVDKQDADAALIVSAGTEGTELSLVFSGSGLNQTILKYIINTYQNGATVIADTMANHPENLESVINELYSEDAISKELSLSEKNTDPYNQYYYALFAMACMFGASYGLFNTEHCQADQSTVAVRRAASPTRKMFMVLSEYLAAVTIMELLFAILVLYLVFILKVDLGNEYGLIALASLVSSLFGVALGYFFGVVFKMKQSVKEGITMGVILFLNFLAGLMMGNMKFVVEKSCPIVNRINPAALISDCFYSICAYDDMNMYIRSILSLCIWIVVLAFGSIMILRREKYANL